jgi:hypothetical protein
MNPKRAANLLGTVRPIGRVRGWFVGADPSGRYIGVLRHHSNLTIHDTHRALAPVFTARLFRRTYAFAFHPSGRSFARLSRAWELELHQKGKKTQWWTTSIRQSPYLATEMAVRWGPSGAGWLQFTADGKWLLLGDVAENAQLTLFASNQLEPLETVSPIFGTCPREPVEDWGEDAMPASAPAPSTAVAIAANAGDSIREIGVAEVIKGKLKLYGLDAVGPAMSDTIPGDRINGICLRHDTLFGVDVDQVLFSLPWRKSGPKAKYLASAYRFFKKDEACPEVIKDLRALGGEAIGESLVLNGPLDVIGNRLLVTVEKEHVRGGLMGWINRAFLVFDSESNELLGWFDAPDWRAESRLALEGNGTLCKTVAGETRVWRYVPPKKASARRR